MQLTQLFSSKKRVLKEKGKALYKTLLAGALNADLYEAGIGEDTFEGRFEQVALHGALLMRALRECDQRDVSEALYEEIFAGLDHAYRETGVGDSSISRKVRKLGERFYGMARGLDSALEDQTDADLAAFVARNGLSAGKPAALVSYLRSAHKGLSQADDIFEVNWPKV